MDLDNLLQKEFQTFLWDYSKSKQFLKKFNELSDNNKNGFSSSESGLKNAHK